MGELVNMETEYKEWIADVASRFRRSQIKASLKVNDEMLKFFWSLGRDMDKLKEKYSRGSHFYQIISRDLKKSLPEIKSFSPRNLMYMNQFYRMFSKAEITPQVVAQLDELKLEIGAEAQTNIYRNIFLIPWGHIRTILDKCADEPDKALFFVNKTFENNWSRAVLLNFLDTDLYNRQGMAISNFKQSLPDVQSDLAQEITKDPYNFDFLTIREKYDEKELKDALMDNITSFLLELGNGFSFVGREVRIDIGKKENYIDMLFFNISLKCYVVLEVKVTDFDSSFAGKLGTYVIAVNHQLKEEWMNPSIGLLVCKGIDKVEAQYALEASNQPIGVSSYQLSKMIPEEFKSSLPTIEEIESELESIELTEQHRDVEGKTENS